MASGAWATGERAAPKAAPGIPIGLDDAPVTYAVGDVHGRYDLLRDLMSTIAADADALAPHRDVTCVFLGDYVDRGPDSASVLTALLWLERNAPFDCVFLRGNHEQVMLDYIANPVAAAAWLRFGGIDTLRSYGVTYPAHSTEPVDQVQLRDRLLDRLPAAHLDFLGRLPTRHESDTHFFVHAGLRPGTPWAGQVDEDLLWIRDDFLDYEGSFEKRVVYGHTWMSDQPEVGEHRIGLDTGAYETGVLTAARLSGQDTRFLCARGKALTKSAASSDPA